MWLLWTSLIKESTVIGQRRRYYGLFGQVTIFPIMVSMCQSSLIYDVLRSSSCMNGIGIECFSLIVRVVLSISILLFLHQGFGDNLIAFGFFRTSVLDSHILSNVIQVKIFNEFNKFVKSSIWACQQYVVIRVVACQRCSLLLGWAGCPLFIRQCWISPIYFCRVGQRQLCNSVNRFICDTFNK